MIDFDACLPTSEMKEEFERFKKMSPNERKQFQEERQKRIDGMSLSEQEKYISQIKNGIDNTITEANKWCDRADEILLRERLGELPEVISFSYIAKKYFGKSRNWLYQRINGYTVNGKKARFTENEFQTFQNALKDISVMINQTSLKLS
jgi:hypothetical protein bacD2_02360|nr:MAG TPA: protein of unknown function (DUF5053) [Caudoviricetes sp.]